MINSINNTYKTIIKVDEDTSFELSLFIDQDKLYFKFIETTAKSPYFYKRSFKKEQLYNLHKIFLCCLSIEEAKDNIISVIENKKMTLKLLNDNPNKFLTLEVSMDVIIFYKHYKIKFEIEKSINKENGIMLDLYKKNKKMLILLKNLGKIIEKNENNKKSCDLINKLKNDIYRHDIPGIKKVKKYKISEICLDYQNQYVLTEKANFFLFITLKNLTDFTWKISNTKLICDKNKSSIIPNLVRINSNYEVEKGQDGEFGFLFPNKGNGRYVCVLNLSVNNKIYYEYEIVLNIIINE